MIILRKKVYSNLNLTGELKMNELPKGRPLRFITTEDKDEEEEVESFG